MKKRREVRVRSRGGFSRRILIRLLALALGGAASLVLMEVALRVTGLQRDFFYQPDPIVGSTYIPGKTGWHSFTSGGRRYRRWIEINSFGYRDREWDRRKAKGDFRIAALGDSYLAGMEVAAESRHTSRLEGLLNSQCGGGFEVMNMGMWGYGTAEEYLTLEHRALQLEPDLVLLFFYTGNDLFNNSPELDIEPNRPHYSLAEDGTLVALPFAISDHPLKRWLRGHSRLFLLLRERFKRAQAVGRLLEKVDPDRSEAPIPTKPENDRIAQLQSSMYLLDPPPEIERAWEVTEALIGKARDLSTRNGADFRLVAVPTREEIDDVPLPNAGGSTDRQAALRRIRQICGKLELDCLELTEAFRQSGVRTEDAFWADEGHWTELGHRIVGQALFEWLCGPFCEGGSAG